MTSPRTLIREAASRLRLAGVPDPENDAALLLSFLCSRPALELRLDQETALDADCLASYESLLLRRMNREPLQYLLEEVPFCGFSFAVDSRALIPRPETELLCLWASEFIAAKPDGRLLDLCCGSGCIGLTLKKRFPSLSLTCSDLSPSALSLARENAERLSCEAEFICSDLFTLLPSRRYDWICSNPPYIPTSACSSLQPEVLAEPFMALDGGSDGLDFYRRIAADAPAFLLPGGRLLMELGFGEAEMVSELLSSQGFDDIQFRKDDRMIDRMISARCPNNLSPYSDGGK
jgi:release factor glutamine methyltransferase